MSPDVHLWLGMGLVAWRSALILRGTQVCVCCPLLRTLMLLSVPGRAVPVVGGILFRGALANILSRDKDFKSATLKGQGEEES